jgi:hypothetical protein
MKHTSTLAQIADKVYQAKTADEAKQVMIDHLSTTRVKDKDRMISQVKVLKTLIKVQTYFTNSLLRFEALSVNSYAPEA